MISERVAQIIQVAQSHLTPSVYNVLPLVSGDICDVLNTVT